MVVQTGEARFVVDLRVKPVKLVGQDKITFAPAEVIVSWGWLTGREMLNIVPLPKLPPQFAVPYRVFPDKTSPPFG